MQATFARDAAGNFIRKAGTMGVVLIGSDRLSGHARAAIVLAFQQGSIRSCQPLGTGERLHV